jgi:hypothetical protein
MAASIDEGNTMKKGFSVTFERYFTHDEGEDICEPDEIGFVIEDVSLRDAVQLGLEYRQPSYSGPCEPNCYPPRDVRWLSFYCWNDCTREQLEQGISESRSLHIPEHITESSRLRICKLFGAVR